LTPESCATASRRWSPGSAGCHWQDAVLADQHSQTVPCLRKELIARLLARWCELCGEPGKLLVHQVRRLAILV